MDDFLKSTVEHNGIRHTVYTKGEGPAVVLLHELPGLSDACINLARELSNEYTVYMPLLFGSPGRKSPKRNFLHVCISKEFRVFARNKTSPIVDWIRAVSRKAHSECGGEGVGVIGMCLTGNFAIALMADANVLAPITCQPSLPFRIVGPGKAALGVGSSDLILAKVRAESGQRLLGFRFSEDRLCPQARFDRLSEEFGNGFIPMVINSSKGNPHGYGVKAHAVLTKELSIGSNTPTQQALDRVKAFLESSLK